MVGGCRELVFGNEEKALEHLEKAVHLVDGRREAQPPGPLLLEV